MAGPKVRHDFASGEESIAATQANNTLASNARDESSTLHRTNQAALGEDVVGSEGVANIARQQFERDTLSIDSAARMHSANQRSQEIQESTAARAGQHVRNRG